MSVELKEQQSESASLVAEADSALQKVLHGSDDVNTEATDLKAQLDKLLAAYQTRESQFTATVAEVKEKYSSIIQEATDKANNILAAAQKSAEESAKAVAESLFASKQSAAEALKTTTEKNNKLVADATAQAAAIQAESAKERAAWEAEKASVADIQKFKPVVKVNVGGTKFTTSLTTLCRFPNTMIGTMYSGRHELVQDEDGYHFIDRDGTHFRYILNYLRSPETFECELTGAALKELKCECEYYGLKKLMFPYTPLAPFKTRDVANESIVVSQDQHGIYRVNGVPVRRCKHCGLGDFAGNSKIKRGGYYDDEVDYIPHFDLVVEDRGGVVYKTQPSVTYPCRVCRK